MTIFPPLSALWIIISWLACKFLMASFSPTVMFCWWLIYFLLHKLIVPFLLTKCIGWVYHTDLAVDEMSDFKVFWTYPFFPLFYYIPCCCYMLNMIESSEFLVVGDRFFISIGVVFASRFFRRSERWGISHLCWSSGGIDPLVVVSLYFTLHLYFGNVVNVSFSKQSTRCSFDWSYTISLGLFPKRMSIEYAIAKTP